MDKKILLDAFYGQFMSFVTELTEMYPDDPDFSLLLTGISVFKNTNPLFVTKFVYNNTIHFEEMITNKDELFFLKYEFSEYEGHVKNPNIFNKLKECYSNMSADTKEFVWKYINNIMRLAKALH